MISWIMQTLSLASGLTFNAALTSLVTTCLCGPAVTSAKAQGAGAAVYQMDVLAMNLEAKPGDSFFAYANGGWDKRTEIPPDRSWWGVIVILREEAERRCAALLEAALKPGAAAGSDERKAADYYAAFMNEAAIEAKGITPLKPELARIEALKDRKELSRWLGRDLRAYVDYDDHVDRLFGLWVSTDFNTPGRNAAYLIQGGLGMPSRDYYLDTSPQMIRIRARYQAHVAAILELAGISDGEAKAARIMELERSIAQVHASVEDTEQPLKGNNPWKRSEFSAHAPGLDWNVFFRAAGLDGESTVIVWQPGAITGISALVASVPLATWKEYLIFHAIDRRSHVLPKAFVAEDFAFYEKTLSDTPQISPRWKRAVQVANAGLGDAVGRLYVQQYFPPKSKAQIEALVKNITTALSARIDRLDWMSPETKIKAKEKLAALYVGVAYPEQWIDYSRLKVALGDALGNEDRAELFEYRRRVAQLRRNADPTEWAENPQFAGAEYIPERNAINFPAAILQPPFFDPAAPAAVNYGAIGAIIGHEISHGFDNNGALYDAHGQMANWWTAEDLAHFNRSGARLVAQFDAYHPFPDLAVNGKLTLSENIADLTGLAVAHDAWLLSLEGKPAPSLQGFSGEQQFFLSYAQNWREKSREAGERRRINTDAHAPVEYRVDTVRNIDAWYSAFDIQPGEPLYLPRQDRVHIW
jgi:putative endopeptidase